MERNSQGYRLIFGYLGTFLIMIGIIILLPLILLIFYPSESGYALNFIIPGLSSILVGGALSLLNFRRKLERLKKYEDMLLLLLIWVSAIFISAIPFILTKEYSISEAIFEMTSGYTTTGLTVYRVSGAPKMYLFFRSLTHYIGGVGLVLVLTSTISDKFGMQLFAAEGHLDRLLPNLVKSARFIFSIYTLYILIGSIFYMIFGMSAFDAVNHAISAVSTGGFSTQVDSIGHYNSLPIEIVSMVLMILGATNFVVHLNLFRRKYKEAINHIELKFLVIYAIIIIPIFGLSLSQSGINEPIRTSSFLFISAMTSTGFSAGTVTFNLFPPFSLLLLSMIMAIGAAQGSTAGGAKLYRISLFFKSIYWQIKEKVGLPNLVEKRHIYYLGKKEIIEKKDINNNYSFLGLYFLVLLLGVAAFSLFGNSLGTSIFEVSSLLGNSGLSIGILTDPNVSNGLLWISSIIMLLGRLEIYVLLFAVAKVVEGFRESVENHKNKAYR